MLERRMLGAIIKVILGYTTANNDSWQEFSCKSVTVSVKCRKANKASSDIKN